MRLGLINAGLMAGTLALAVVVAVQAPGWFRGPDPLASVGAAATPGGRGPEGGPPGAPAGGPTRAGQRNPFASLQRDKAGKDSETKNPQGQVKTLDPEKLKFEVLGVVVGRPRNYAIAASRAAGQGQPFRVEVGSRLDGFQVDRITSESLWLIGADGQRYQYELGRND